MRFCQEWASPKPLTLESRLFEVDFQFEEIYAIFC
jgi:hypothetical protein